MIKRAISLVLIVLMVIGSCVLIPVSAKTATNDEISSAKLGAVKMKGTNSLGSMLAAEYEENADDDDSANKVFQVEIDGRSAAAEVRVLTDAKVILAIYDEESNALSASAMTTVTSDDKIARLSFEVDLPKYFTAKAFLVDAQSNIPLCKEFVCDTYTKDMQEFLSKTTDDFEEEKILNLDESSKDNFLVYNDDTILIDNSSDTNVIKQADDSNKKYVIENIDETIASLKEGDIFAYDFDTDNTLIIKVSSISIEGTTATVYGDEMELYEVFDYIKIDSDKGAEEAEVDNSTLDEDVEYVGKSKEASIKKYKKLTGLELIDNEGEGSAELSYKVEKKKDDTLSLSGTLGCKFTAEFKCYYDAKLFKKDEVEVSYAVKYEASLDIAATLKGEKTAIKLGTYGIMVCPCVFLDFTPSIVFEGSISVNFNGKLSGQVGKTFKNGKFTKNDKAPYFSSEISVSGQIFVGLSLKPKLGLVGDILTFESEAKAGVTISAAMRKTTETDTCKHMCSECIEGDITASAEVSLTLKLLKSKKLSWTVSATPWRKKITDFYYSFDKNKFGWTTCPNYTYKTTVTVVDASGQPIEGATVKAGDIAFSKTTNSKGKTTDFIKKGKVYFKASKSGYKTKSKTKTISDTDSFSITLSKTSSTSYTASANSVSSAPVYLLGGFNNWQSNNDSKMYDESPTVTTKTLYLAEGSYEFKFKQGDAWFGNNALYGWQYYNGAAAPTLANSGNSTFSKSGNNCQLVVKSGVYTFKYNKENRSLTIYSSSANKSYYLVGGFNNWSASEASVMEGGSHDFIKKKMYLKAGTYEFKLRSSSGNWLGNNGTIEDTTTTSSNTGWQFSDNAGNCKLKASGGYYTFVYSTGSGNLKVYYEKAPSSATVRLLGDFNNWSDTSANNMTYSNGVFKKTIKLSKGTYGFKIKTDGYNHYLGNTGVINDNTGSDWIFDWSYNNCTLSLSGGTYTFIYNYDTHLLNVSRSSGSKSSKAISKKQKVGENIQESSLHKVTKSGLVPNTECLFYILDEDSLEDLSPEYLYYIDQKMTDETGTVEFEYYGDLSDKFWVSYIAGECAHEAGEWVTSIEPTGKTPGEEVRLCEKCGDVIETRELEYVRPAPSNSVYFVNSEGWNTVNCYLWNNSTKENEYEWPGQRMSVTDMEYNGFDVYSYTYDTETYDYCIFTNGDDRQTTDLSASPAFCYDYENNKWIDIAEIETENTIEGIMEKAFSPDSEDTNVNSFELPTGIVYKGGKLLGYQKKNTSENSIRFVTVLSSRIINNKDVKDYGYVFTATDKDIETSKVNSSKLNIENGHVYSCLGTFNQIAGAYGSSDTNATKYKYVTAAINNIPEGKTIVARFYITTSDGTYYTTYSDKNNNEFSGCAARLK